MTKSLGIGKGGARPNSGPKPKPRAPSINIDFVVVPPAESAAELAKPYRRAVIESLARIACEGANESARVAAGKTLLEYTDGKPGAVVVTEKKDEAKPGQPDASDPWAAVLRTPKPTEGAYAS